ncbi:MAG: protein-PII uridylyltransferase, partial [SAR324 cluster bacterium]|nr:protein-PII uridylyltransferase [SAR324 cluster bacterium]
SGLALEYLTAREQSFMEVVSGYFSEIHQQLIMENLESNNAFRVLARNTHLLDAILLVTAGYVLEDLPAIKEILVEELERECGYKLRVLPEKEEKRGILRKEVAKYANPESTDEQNLGNYYRRVCDELTQEIQHFQERLEAVQKLLPQARNCTIDLKEVLEHLVVFARGGYGRAELSFASDRDLGYCLDTRRLEAGAVKLYQQIVVRIEQLLNRAGIETAHQYFEIDEDLSRFREPGSLHTIPSILESRVLLGSPELAAELKRRFFQVLPYEPYVLSKIEEYHGRREPSLNLMNIKEDHGGLRTLQIPLWITAATFGEFPSQTADLLALLIQRRILTPRQGLKVCQALEFFYDLRNFSGAAQSYYNEEAQASGCVDTDLKANIINDSLERLYLLKKQRFRTVDEFDRFWLQMVHNIQILSRTILRKLLDRTMVRTFASFQAVVQLRKRRIVE